MLGTSEEKLDCIRRKLLEDVPAGSKTSGRSKRMLSEDWILSIWVLSEEDQPPLISEGISRQREITII